MAGRQRKVEASAAAQDDPSSEASATLQLVSPDGVSDSRPLAYPCVVSTGFIIVLFWRPSLPSRTERVRHARRRVDQVLAVVQQHQHVLAAERCRDTLDREGAADGRKTERGADRDRDELGGR
jgi:hypothetical protein